ncbi:AsnC family transcriptional regulator [Desulfitibacter alkalitolerans]|uniref:siroheme decarboxylase subunit alpha n=1 Tax=Desulfitibacter alkalitolerans TaxID=264641 RepID=UPI00047FB7A3|nr:AsnC family transcriptional regulator [Desulfitibacter alkalitolerans]
MDSINHRLLEIIQDGFPISPEPYKDLAMSLGVSEEEIIDRISKLQDQGIIRRLGAIFDSRKLGYKSTLCAMKVPKDQIEHVAEIVNSYPGVTHNYLREHKYNMWFTLIAPSKEHIDKICSEIILQSGINELMQLPARRFFKIKVKFSVKGEK